jgi:flagellar basal-body rod protein FlgF
MDAGAIALLSNSMALQRRVELTANNLANASTPGFKREQMVFRTIAQPMADAPPSQRVTMLPIDVGSIHDVRPGGFVATGGQFDVAIEGPGWFAVSDGGQTHYTRDGGFRLDPAGQLVNGAGAAVLDPQGRPVSVPPEQAAGAVVRPDGVILGQQGEIARIGVYGFPDEAQLVQIGGGMWQTDAAATPVATAKLRTGGVEGSNVQPITETSDLMEMLRGYETSQRMAEGLADLRQRTIDRFGRN